jgi:hypothetical protein
MSALLLAALLLFGATVHRGLLARCGGGWFLHVLRLPGNFLHEAAHALGFFLTGYTVRGFSVSLVDPEGRGHVQSGSPWFPWARPWLAGLVSPVAPAIAGVLVLSALHAWMSPSAVAWRVPATWVPDGSTLVDSPWTWAVLAVATPIAAEASPSDVDWKLWRGPGAVLLTLLAGAWALGHWVWPPLETALVDVARSCDRLATPHLLRALVLSGWSAAAWLVPAWLIGGLRARWATRAAPAPRARGRR